MFEKVKSLHYCLIISDYMEKMNFNILSKIDWKNEYIKISVTLTIFNNFWEFLFLFLGIIKKKNNIERTFIQATKI